jgi:Histidine phosphatase superfamily (branch 2)
MLTHLGQTVSLGYSSFCSLFTQSEWEGFEYALDLYFYYDSGPGAPTARALGAGYITELLARLTHTPIKEHRTSTNATLDDNPITFPLDQHFYVDATHEVVVVNVLTALNLTALWDGGKLTPYEMTNGRKFIASRLAPFATNVQFQRGFSLLNFFPFLFHYQHQLTILS